MLYVSNKSSATTSVLWKGKWYELVEIWETSEKPISKKFDGASDKKSILAVEKYFWSKTQIARETQNLIGFENIQKMFLSFLRWKI